MEIVFSIPNDSVILGLIDYIKILCSRDDKFLKTTESNQML